MSTEITSSGKTFVHYHAAHCESGVTSALFRDQGLDISEALVFGIGSGIFFGHFPFIKMVGLPITTFRSQPGAVFRKAGKRLGVKFITERFRNSQKGMDELRRLLKEGKIVGMTTNIYWLSYFPNRFRFQFNGHNLIALREIEGGFRVSDPVLEYPVDCLTEDLERARFAHGPLEPRGFMYYTDVVPQRPDIRGACIRGIKDTCNMMLRIPLPIVGIHGIRFLARRIKKSPQKLGFAEACRHLGNIVRMQEEIGTGGAGFRFMYAAFLQEAAELFNSSELTALSAEMTAIGDLWREFAIVAARIIKQRGQTEDTFDKVSDILMECAAREKDLFKEAGFYRQENENMNALEISGITFSYDHSAGKADDELSVEAGAYALRNFSMSVENGDVHALLGPNGAGKTTLMRIITGQLRGYTGDVNIYDRPVADNISLNSFGFAPQPISVFTALTARENLRFFGVMAGLSQDRLQQRAEEVLKETGLGEHAEKKVAKYSGGMLRRLNLAVALLHSPRLLFLDEPTVGVDPQSRNHIYATLNKLNAAGVTILLCTHMMEEAQRLCSKVTLVDKGRMVFSGNMAGINNLETFFLERTGHGLRDDG